MFPFVIDVSFLKVNESKYTDGRRILDNPQIKLIVSPAHRAELYSEDIEYKVKNHIREKLIPLLIESIKEMDNKIKKLEQIVSTIK
jgi:hypothetical protein